MQPYNHLPIEPYFVQPGDIPTTPPASPQQTPRPVFAPPTLPSLIFPSLPDDTALLSTTYILSILRTKSNVASFIRGGGLLPLRALGEDELMKRGKEVLERAGIELRKDWDPLWWVKCVATKGANPMSDADDEFWA